MNILTQKQETFCLKYIELGNATEAALIAGYSHKTARSIASINLTKQNIIERIKQLRQATEDTTIASVVERKQILTEIVRGRFADFMTHLTAEKLRSAALQEIRIVEFTGGKDGRAKEKATTIKLHSPIQAIAELNKMERIYEAVGSMVIQNQILTINVTSEKSRDLTQRLMEGERTGEGN